MPGMMEKGAELLGGKSRAAPNGAKSSSPSNGHYSEPESGGGDSGDEHGASLGPPRRRRQGGGGGGGRGGEPSRLPFPGAGAPPLRPCCGRACAGRGAGARGAAPRLPPRYLTMGRECLPGAAAVPIVPLE